MTNDQLSVLETLQLRALETTETMQAVLAALEITEDFTEGDRVYYWHRGKLLRQAGKIVDADVFCRYSGDKRVLVLDEATGVRRIVKQKYCILKDSN